MELRVSELFYAPQGEGGRAGEPSLFVRLQGCSAKHACYASGVRCDTEFESGRAIAVDDLVLRLRALSAGCQWIVWTGGEPLDQLTDDILAAVRGHGYRQAIETSGVVPMSRMVAELLDWITISPKVAEHVLAKNFPWALFGMDHGRRVTELRYVRHAGQEIPQPSLTSDLRYISPHFDGLSPNDANLRHCLRLVLDNPTWRLSVQQHKILGTL